MTWPQGSGEMVATVRDHDWSATPLGAIDGWPQSLKTAVDLMLATAQPVYIAWGPHLVSIYNDGYIPIAGAKHPAALGQPFCSMWSEVMEEYRPVVDAVLAGEPQYFIDRPMALTGRASPMSWFTFSWTPLRSDDGDVCGLYAIATETTDQVLARRALETSRRAVFDSIDQGYCRVDLIRNDAGKPVDMRYIEVNRLFEAQTGLRDVVGKSQAELDLETELYWFERYGRVSDTGIATRFESYHEGTGRWYDVLVTPSDTGTADQVSLLFSDVTTRRRANTIVRESEERLRGALNAMGEGFALFGRDFTILDVNEATERMDGRPREELVGQSHWDAFPGSEHSELGDLYRRVMVERQWGGVEHLYAWPDGRAMWVDVRAYPMPDGGIASFWRDITERRQIEGALRESERRKAFLLKLSDAMRPMTASADLERVAIRLLGDELGVDRAFLAKMDPGGETWSVAHVHGPLAPGMIGRYPLSDFQRSRLPKWQAGVMSSVTDSESDADITAPERAVYAAFGMRAAVGMPLVRHGQFAALLVVNQKTPRAWTSAELAIVHDTADRVWDAIERARIETILLDREAELALTQEIGRVASVDVTLTDPPTGARSLEYRRLHGLPLDTAEETHADWLARLHPEDRASQDRLFQDAIDTIDAYETEYRIVRPDTGDVRWIGARAEIERDANGRAVRLRGAHIDITDRKRADAALGASERFARALIEGVPQLIWCAVGEGDWTWASPQWTDYTGQDEATSHGRGWLDAVHPADRDAVLAAWASASGGDEFRADYRIRYAAEGRYRWFQTRATPVYDDHERIIEWLGTSTDVDDLRQLQERQRVLVGELQHRVRNILTVVRAVYGRTMAAGGDAQDIADHFRGRLDALARTQVVATQNTTGSIDLENLIRDELLSVGAADSSDVVVAGPDVALPHKTAESIGLAIHELTTNALKYGALKVPGASLRIEWSANIVYGEARHLILTWTEHGVPALSVHPTRCGFGSELIREALPYRLDAETKLEFLGGGVRCTISLPLPGQPGASDERHIRAEGL